MFPSDKQLPDTLILAGGSRCYIPYMRCTMLSMSLDDVRINKMHPYKMLATLQHNAPKGSGIQLLKTIPGGGHGPAKSRTFG